MEGRPGHVHQAQGTYDPITNQWLHAPAGTVAQTAGDRSRQDEHDWAVNKTGIMIMGICMFQYQSFDGYFWRLMLGYQCLNTQSNMLMCIMAKHLA